MSDHLFLCINHKVKHPVVPWEVSPGDQALHGHLCRSDFQQQPYVAPRAASTHLHWLDPPHRHTSTAQTHNHSRDHMWEQRSGSIQPTPRPSRLSITAPHVTSARLSPRSLQSLCVRACARAPVRGHSPCGHEGRILNHTRKRET